MKDLHRAPLLAVFLIVLLRMSIGWQFLYEGLWKKETLSTPTPWTSEGYLKNAQGPFRDYFRSMTGDPDDFKWLDYAAMSQRWYDWRDRFVKHYQLDEKQQNVLNQMLDGSTGEDTPAADLPPTPTLRQPLTQLPPEVTAAKLGDVVGYDAAKKELTARGPLLPSEEADLLELVDVKKQPDGSFAKINDPMSPLVGPELEFVKAVERLAFQSRQLSYRHRLAAQLRGNPENVGVTGRKNDRGSFDIVMGTVTMDAAGADANNVRYGKIQEYKDLVQDYNSELKHAKIDYQNDHATMLGKKLASMRSELVGPIRSLDSSLKESAINLLTPAQLKLGNPTGAETPLARSDRQVMWGLIILGTLLIVGLATRVAAVLGAVMLMMFYLVIPPWPGIPQGPGPEHSFIINKNMIEAIALLAIAALPTGRWFGIDSLFSAFTCCRKKPAAPQTVALNTTPPVKK
ncbi:DoxX family protein [Planctomicrobium piriforme]|uniref:DoxX protein n=1 Tax=Planctomicrobium piriforme TaxID=1576369 RepID=A0A1I3RQX4_9PLAN|nr:DoxX family protein [Planctomicrobium piriforme]SFJ48698.1 hypothetical protein SAMN05421753_12192 [Planctomicrobium piriforme]